MSKKLLMLAMGGTLACVDSENGLRPGMGEADIIDSISHLIRHHTLEYRELFSLDSSNIQPEEWVALAHAIHAARDEADGIIVIHGTDTMAYTAAALSFMLRGIEIPVVLTGSQLSISDPIADAMENVRAAVSMALSDVPGIFVAFNRKIILGTRASKIKTLDFDAFESINYPYIATISGGGLNISCNAIPAPCTACGLEDSLCTEVGLVKLFPGMNPSLITALCDQGCKGLYIEAFGRGGIPFLRRNAIAAIEDAVRRGMAVVVGSQCLYDGSDFSVYETGTAALAAGVIEARDMTCEAVIAKLMWALGKTKDPAQIRAYFGKSFAGEICV